jgi:3-dehydroquinate dehydratase-2
MSQILLLHGPNLNLLGEREPGIYGDLSLAGIEAAAKTKAESLGMTLRCLQSNSEGALVDAIHAARHDCQGVVINAGAYTHTSVALHDALRGTRLPFIEVHLSNVYARETFRHKSYLSAIAIGVICGFGPQGYDFALEALAKHLKS